MKKIFISLILFFSLFSTYQSYHKTEKKYLKRETLLKQLKKDVFLAKLQKPLPQWMQDQIQENLKGFESGIEKESIDATFAQIQKTLPSPYIIHYRILDNELYRYFREGELISLQDNSTEKAIKTLMQLVKLPNLDCILSLYDGIRPNHIFFHTEKQAPLLISAKIKNTPYIVLIPDWRSLGQWWASDIKTIQSHMDTFPWDKKIEFARWRGTYNREERKELCILSLKHPEILDAKFNLPLDAPQIEDLMGGRLSWEKLLQCKYQPYVDGYLTASPALQWRLLSNSVTFKPTTEEVQWFHRALRPYVHYIPLQKDVSDFVEKFEWAKNHDAECQQIAKNAKKFALENLMYEDVLIYFNAVLQSYGKLQKIDVNAMKREMANDSRWVNIQYRQKLCKIAKKKQGYCKEAYPEGGIISASETSPIP